MYNTPVNLSTTNHSSDSTPLFTQLHNHITMKSQAEKHLLVLTSWLQKQR